MNIMDIQNIQFESQIKRGRPPTSSLPTKIQEGINSISKIKCPLCNRKFPRNKSLQAHLRTHTGEKPYVCDYPGCEMAFKQSGHLRSHLYRHAQEKRYGCPVEGCDERFIHSHRKCPTHKELKLVRDGQETIRSDLENISEAEAFWLTRYMERKSARVSSAKTENLRRKRPLESSELLTLMASQNSLSSNGTSGYSSSEEPASLTPNNNNTTEVVNDVRESSFCPSPKKTNSDVEVKQRAESTNDKTTEVKDVRESFCPSPKKRKNGEGEDDVVGGASILISFQQNYDYRFPLLGF